MPSTISRAGCSCAATTPASPSGSTTRWASCRGSASTTRSPTAASTSGRIGRRASWASAKSVPHWQVDAFRRRDGLGLESRYQDVHLPFNFNDGAFIEIGVNPNVEVIRQPFTINSSLGVQVFPAPTSSTNGSRCGDPTRRRRSHGRRDSRRGFLRRVRGGLSDRTQRAYEREA